MLCCRERVFEDQALRKLHLRVIIERRAAQTFSIQSRRTFQDFFTRKHPVMRKRFVERKQIVGNHPGANGPEAAPCVAVDRNQDGERSDKMWRDAKQRLALAQ